MPTLLALVVLIAALGPGEPPEYAPAGTEAYTLDLELDGFENGYMPADRLLKVGNCLLERDAAYTYSLMFEEASADGIKLRPSSCYRTFAVQDRAYNRRCPITKIPVYSTDSSGGKVQTGTRQQRICTGPPTAKAGQSNHGWGRAIDFIDNRDLLTCFDEEFLWLQRNAHRFGWVHPPWAQCRAPLEEAWHWEFAGVTDPTLVDYVRLDPSLIATAE
ncbi:MAG: M15 family metallopeptidase [Acidimicrobiia bacterium]